MHLQAEALPLSHEHHQHTVSHWHLPPPPREVTLPSSPASPHPVPILPRKPPSKLPPAPSCLETRAMGTLVGALTSESLESPMYASCPKTIEFQAQARRMINYIGSIQHPTCAYRADGGRQPLVQDFLRGDPTSPRLDGNVVAIVAGASRACWISRRGVRPTFPLLVPTEGSTSPSQSEVTYVGRSYLDEPVGGQPSARGCFDQHSPTVDHVCRGIAS
jgi:hypothetical protein